VEGGPPTKGNPSYQSSYRTQCWVKLKQAEHRIRQVAQRDKEAKFTALWHHVYDTDRLREAYLGLKRKAAAGVDGMTWSDYRQDLEGNLQDLSAQLQRGAYRARPVRRTYIPKADGRQRPLGVTCMEDKIVQRATVDVLNAIYETDFLGFSYGFRPGRSQHDVLDALSVGIQKRKVNWVLDADIRGYFDAISHEWLVRFLEHRIADQRVIRHVKKWLYAGVLEDGEWRQEEHGTPQGGSLSPLLANIYLHYVFDLWANQWRQRHSHGDIVIVRYADDIVVGFEDQGDAKRFLAQLVDRFANFGLELHDTKTRLIEFGRYAAERRARRGAGKPETFDFLGFTHVCARRHSDGSFVVHRRTMRKRLHAKLAEVKVELRRRLHHRVSEVGQWLASVLRGHYQYYGVPSNSRAMDAFRFQLVRLWFRALRRRSQRHKMTWDRMTRLANGVLPYPRIQHPWPAQRLRV
jgi:group II intron reverse transcriptase/maturase